MSARITKLIFILMSGAFLLAGCDTERNMESPLEKSFVKFVGRDGNQSGTDVAVAKDRSIYLLGSTLVHEAKGRSHLQLYVLKTSPSGMVLWETTLGSKHDDEARDIEILSDSTLAILGVETDSLTSKKQFTLTIIGTDMTVINTITDGSLNYNDEAISVTEVSDSYIVTGYTDSTGSAIDLSDGFWLRYYKDLTKYSSSWGTQLGGDDDFDIAVKTLEVAPYFYVFGNSNNLQSNDGVPDNNVIIWVLGPNGGPANSITIGNSLLPGSDAAADEFVGAVTVVPPQSGEGFLITGYSRDATNQTIFALKVRRNLELVDEFNIDQMFSAPPLLDQSSVSGISTSPKTAVFSSPGSGFFVAGTVNENIYLKKLDNGLHDAWTSPASFQYGGIGSDSPGAVVEAPDGRILLIGTMVLGEATHQQKIVLIKLSPNGKLGE